MVLKKYFTLLETNPKATDLLRSLWSKEKKTLGLTGDMEKSICRVLELFFNPFRKKSSLRKNIHQLPTTDILLYTDRDLLDFLSDNELVFIFPEEEGEFITLTPEGVAIASLMNKQDSIFLDLASVPSNYINRFQSMLYRHYRKNSLRKVKQLTQQTKRKNFLGINQMSITLFLLVNGSIGKARAFSIESDEVQSATEKIIRAFVQHAGEKRRKVYPFNWYLTTAKRIMGDVFYNKYPLYFIYEDKVGRVRDFVKRSTEKMNDFKQRWSKFLDEYKKQRPILRSHKVSFFSESETLELEQKLFW